MSARNRALSRLGQHIAASREQGDRPMDYDAIKAALREAGKTLQRPWPTFNSRGMTAVAQREKAHDLAAARAVASFLRAPDVWGAIMEDYEAVTAAVERAAREGGDA